MLEQGPIRPPSEASSLLVRVTRNCPWNRCHICPAYKGEAFSMRSVKEVKGDIDRMAEAYASYAGTITSAFLQDGDNLLLPTDNLVEIIMHLRQAFPNVQRVTTYARAKSMRRKSLEEFRILKEAGLTRIHTGMESGSLKVLTLIKKGITPEDILMGGTRVVESGISLSEYIMPGVGGRTLSREHAIETARLLNEIKPDFIRVRTFAMHPQSPMQKMIEDGTFVPMTDEEIVAEIKMVLEHLEEMPAHFRCGDFSLNLLMHVDGPLNTHKEPMIQELDRYLAMPKERKRAFSLLQRSNPGLRSQDVLQNDKLVEGLKKEIERLDREEDGFDNHIRTLMSCQLPQLPTGCWNRESFGE